MPESKEKSSLTHSFTHNASLTALSSSHSALHFRLSLFDAVPRPSKGERKKREEKMKKAHTQSGVSVLRLFGITLSPLFALSHSHTLNEFPFRLSSLFAFSKLWFFSCCHSSIHSYRTYQYFLLGTSLANVLDIPDIPNYTRSLAMVLQEYEHFLSSESKSKMVSRRLFMCIFFLSRTGM